MVPYSNQGREFRFENELDEVLIRFAQAIDLFDSRESDKHRLMDLRSTPEFEKAYRELGSPDIWPSDPPSEVENRVINPGETIELHDKLQQSLAKRDRRTWRRYRQRFVEDTLAEYRTTINWMCVGMHKQSIDDLLDTLSAGQDEDARRTALCNLVKFDSWFLAAPGADVTIRRAAISNDQEFTSKLARALDPKQVTATYEKLRQRYALTTLSCLGYKGRSYGDWARFFEYYNQQLGEPSGRPTEPGFWSFEQWHTVKAAIKQHGVPKKSARPGPRKKRAD
jgi:hypothetical protein